MRRETLNRIIRRFNSVISMKNLAEYEERLVRQKEAESAVKAAEEMTDMLMELLQ